jgi:hypothetical protein
LVFERLNTRGWMDLSWMVIYNNWCLLQMWIRIFKWRKAWKMLQNACFFIPQSYSMLHCCLSNSEHLPQLLCCLDRVLTQMLILRVDKPVAVDVHAADAEFICTLQSDGPLQNLQILSFHIQVYFFGRFFSNLVFSREVLVKIIWLLSQTIWPQARECSCEHC